MSPENDKKKSKANGKGEMLIPWLNHGCWLCPLKPPGSRSMFIACSCRRQTGSKKQPAAATDGVDQD